MQRPSVDVIVPFKGSPAALADLRRRLGELVLAPGDSALVVDNGPEPLPVPDGPVPVHWVGQVPTPAFARNAGAGRGSADWIVFCDADTHAPPGLLDHYFDPPPAERTGLIGGGVLDEPAPANAGVVARYGHLRGVMSQEGTFDFGDRWGYPKTANVACRRAAFEQVGGFTERIRAAEDADLTYRLRAAGWEVERREHASVVHSSRTTLRGLVVQQALWGAGGAWVAERYPGSVPLVGRAGLVRWALSTTLGGFARAVRERSRDAAIMAVMRPVEALAWEYGRRLLSNEREAR
ncbi:MAG TPA: glycosyltransferase family 2 protein [Thermoleophilaceae bacterium]|nr:glycosyltransferase family 2 protein [Thermoleophilaceae bacterium]